MSIYLPLRPLFPKTLFDTPAHREKLFRTLRKHFPRAIVCVVLPKEAHLIVDESDIGTTHNKLLKSLHKSFPWVQWDTTLRPRSFEQASRELVAIRALLLLPCKRGLSKSPFQWNWSTALDLFGARTDPWTPMEFIENRYGENRSHFGQKLHDYIMSDESLEPHQREELCVAPPMYFALHPLSRILAATALAHRLSPHQVLQESDPKTDFLRLAHYQGHRHILSDCKAPSTAAKKCIGDERLVKMGQQKAAAYALSKLTGKSGRTLFSHASTIEGVASSKSGCTIHKVASRPTPVIKQSIPKSPAISTGFPL